MDSPAPRSDRRKAWLFWVLAIVCWPGAVAAGSARKVLLDPGSEAALSRRIRAEASQAGLEVVVLRARSIRGEGDAARAFAGDPETGAVVALASAREVCVYQPSGGGVSRDVLRGSSASDDFFPLRIVEHLRARLTALPAKAADEAVPDAPAAEDAPPTTHDDAPARKDAEPAPSPRSPAPKDDEGLENDASSEAADTADTGTWWPAPRAFTNGLWLEGGLGYGARLDGFEEGARGALGARYVVAPLSVGAVAVLPFASSEHADGAHTASARSWSILVKGAFLFEPARGLGLSAGPGAGILVQHLNGDAAPPLVTRDESVVAAALFAHGEASWALAPWMALAVAVHAGAVAPRVAVRFEGREVTDTGTFFADALVTARVRLAVGGDSR